MKETILWIDSIYEDVVEYPANTGTMYVFSSSIPHFVKKNNMEQDRVSISFNLSLK